MKTLKELVKNEVRSSMLFVSLGISLLLSITLISFEWRQLSSDFTLVEYFVLETSLNAVVLEQPIIIQRSVAEFWRAFAKSKSAIVGLSVHIGNDLVAETGLDKIKLSNLKTSSRRCKGSAQGEICLTFVVDPFILIEKLVVALCSVLLGCYGVYFFRKKLLGHHVAKAVRPLENEIRRISILSEKLVGAIDNQVNLNDIRPSVYTGIDILEAHQLSQAYHELIDHSQKYFDLQRTTEVSRSLNELSTQVAHDIRSPVTALKMVVSHLPEMAEDKANLIRNAIDRINDIADSLLRPRGSAELKNSLIDEDDSVLLSTTLESILSEKKIEFINSKNITFSCDFEPIFGAFAKANEVELKRIVSNLINNSIEAMQDGVGLVTVSLRKHNGVYVITISDNGRGIPEMIVQKLMLGSERISHGKSGTSSGFGLGIKHAKSTIESFGGKFEILSKEGIGTLINIFLEHRTAPSWFANSINIENSNLLIFTDSDSLRALWRKKLSSIHGLNMSNITFLTSNELHRSFHNGSASSNTPLVLIDYDVGEDQIRNASLNSPGANCIVMASYSANKEIIRLAYELKYKILPKELLNLVEVVV